MLTWYESDQLYPYRYYSISPLSGSVSDSGSLKISFTFKWYSGSPTWQAGRLDAINFVELWFYDASGNLLDTERADDYTSKSISSPSGTVTIDLSKCTNQYKATAASVGVLIDTTVYSGPSNAYYERVVPVADSSLETPRFTMTHYSSAGAPTSFSCSPTLTDSTTTLSWSGATAGTSNTIASYEIQYCESSDGSAWGNWAELTTVTSTATSGTKSVSASATYGNYRKFRIRTRGSAGSTYYSGWKESTNTVRRKWAPFGSWTDPTLTARSSMIRAVYLTEMQARVNTIRTFYGLSSYSFTAVTARSTKIAKWASLIQEIRTAIDGITTSHAAWNTLEVGKPRIAHITQLRSIIDGL